METNAADLLRKLSPDEIRQRLAQLDGEQRALRMLLRAALAMQRKESAPAKGAIP